MSFVEIHEILSQIRIICSVEPITVNVHDRGLQIAEHYGFSIYDAMIIAAALLADCTILYNWIGTSATEPPVWSTRCAISIWKP